VVLDGRSLEKDGQIHSAVGCRWEGRTMRFTEWSPRYAARQFGSQGGAAIGELIVGLNTMTHCPKCQSDRVSAGRIVSDGEGQPSVFRPASLRASSFTLHGGVGLRKACFACAECGLVWGFVDTEAFEKFLKRHCGPPDV
jgi:hypothetical protein